MGQVQLQMWSTDIMTHRAYPNTTAIPDSLAALAAYIAWAVASTVCWWVCWMGGMNFTLRLSLSVNLQTMTRIIRAPVDKFFDRTPVGRIMNRLSTDLVNVDTQCYNQVTKMCHIFFSTFTPLAYVHVIMPFYFTLFTAPLYIMMAFVLRRYW